MLRTEVPPYTREGLVVARDYERCLSTKCRHVANDSYYGKPFLLEPFQREDMWKPLFASGEATPQGWRRRFRRAVFGLPSGFGKTELAAAIVLTVATMEVRYEGQYGVVASSKDQVRNIFGKISAMIHLDDDLDAQWEVGKNVIRHRETGARIMVLPNKADALESWHFNVLVFDELHTYRDDSVWAAGLKGQKVLENPLTIGITTAAGSRDGFLWEMLQKAGDDPGLYLYWLGLDDGDDLDDQKAWDKLMVASWVTWESIQDQRSMASSLRAFERYTANRFPADRDAYSCFTSHQLDACEALPQGFDPSLPFVIGIDGATSGDSFAVVAYQETPDGMGAVREWVFDEPDRDTGHYDLAAIMELVAMLCAGGRCALVGLDPNRLIVFASQLRDIHGIDPVAFAQNNAVMCQASSLVTHLVKDRRISLQGCPKTREHLANCIEDDKGAFGTRFGKNSRKDKIDAAIALAIAVLAWETQVKGGDTGEAVPAWL